MARRDERRTLPAPAAPQHPDSAVRANESFEIAFPKKTARDSAPHGSSFPFGIFSFRRRDGPPRQRETRLISFLTSITAPRRIYFRAPAGNCGHKRPERDLSAGVPRHEKGGEALRRAAAADCLNCFFVSPMPGAVGRVSFAEGIAWENPGYRDEKGMRVRSVPRPGRILAAGTRGLRIPRPVVRVGSRRYGPSCLNAWSFVTLFP